MWSFVLHLSKMLHKLQTLLEYVSRLTLFWWWLFVQLKMGLLAIANHISSSKLLFKNQKNLFQYSDFGHIFTPSKGGWLAMWIAWKIRVFLGGAFRPLTIIRGTYLSLRTNNQGMPAILAEIKGRIPSSYQLHKRSFQSDAFFKSMHIAFLSCS